MRSAAFLAAERTRRFRRSPTAPQRNTIAHLAGIAEIETPTVRWSNEASDAITRLEAIVREPTLGPM